MILYTSHTSHHIASMAILASMHTKKRTFRAQVLFKKCIVKGNFKNVAFLFEKSVLYYKGILKLGLSHLKTFKMSSCLAKKRFLIKEILYNRKISRHENSDLRQFRDREISRKFRKSRDIREIFLHANISCYTVNLKKKNYCNF